MTTVSSINPSDSFELAPEDASVALAALSQWEATELKLVFVLDQVSRKFLKLDGPCEDFFNLTREEMLADPEAWTRAVDALDRASANTLREDLRLYGKVVRVVQSLGRDGRRRTLRASVVLHHEQGRVLVAGSVSRVYGESSAKDWSSVIRGAIEEAHEGIAVTDAGGNYLYLNREHLAVFGYETMDELIGKSWRVLYSAEGMRQIEQGVFPELAAKGRWRGLVQGKRRDGSLFPQALSLSLLSNGGIVCNCQDVSERVRLSERLERSETMFRVFLNTVPVGVTIRNLAGEYEFVNQAASSFLGLGIDPKETPQGLKLCPTDESRFPFWRTVAQRVVTTATAERFDFPLSWGDREGVLEVEKLPMRIGSSDVTHVCTLIKDVTEARRMQAQWDDIARRRDEYLVMQREFVSMVSHEFRTPLTAIIGVQYLMSKSVAGAAGPNMGDFRRWLELQGQALGTLRELVDQVLLLNRIEHLASAVPQRLELGVFLAKIMNGIAVAPVNQRLQLELDLPAGFTVAVCETNMRALVENLVSNGLKYSAEIVSVHVGADEREWWLSVTDRGRGIPQKDQKKLFTPFFRAGNSGTVTGTGLGLTIVQRCASFHGGKVEVESREGQGSTFTAKFPRELRRPVPTRPFIDRVPSSNSFTGITPTSL
jgi:PAS domain S-box-containing protein